MHICTWEPSKDKINLPKCQTLTDLFKFLLVPVVSNMFHYFLCPGELVLFDLLVPEHQHVGMVSPPPAWLQHGEISSCSNINNVNNPGAWRSNSLTEQHVPWLVQQVCEDIKGRVEVRVFEEPVVVVVRHAGIFHISAHKNYFGNIQKIWWQQLKRVVSLEN